MAAFYIFTKPWSDPYQHQKQDFVKKLTTAKQEFNVLAAVKMTTQTDSNFEQL